MPDITIPDAAVEAAARALDANFNPDRYPIMAAMFRDYASTALDAAAPHIAAQALRDMGEWFDRAAQLGTGELDVIAAQACYDRAAQIEADHG